MIQSDTPDQSLNALTGADEFHARHIGPQDEQQRQMLAAIGYASRHELIRDTIPASILRDVPLSIVEPTTEAAALSELADIAERNQVWRSYIGAGYHGTITPEPIRRNLLENPGWYTAYTPYQAEVAQGRLESLMNFQQMVIDLTGLPVANASLLDEASAAAEAMGVLRRASRHASNRFLVDAAVHPQVIAVIRTRARWMGIEVVVADADGFDAATVFGAHVQCPDTFGRLRDVAPLADALHAAGGKLSIGVDPLAALLVRSAGAMGADIAIGSAQRFGVPLGNGGPHAAFMAVRQDLVRMMPGRIIGVSKDAAGNLAYRMSLQTREQHIRRDKATSNICTAQALLGQTGLARLARLNHANACDLADRLATIGLSVVNTAFFNEVTVRLGRPAAPVVEALAARGIMAGVPVSRLLPGGGLDDALIIASTEVNTPEDRAALVAAMKETL